VQRVLAQRGRDVRLLDALERDRQRAVLEDERQVLRLGEHAGARAELDLATARDAVRESRVRVVDLGKALDVPVEDDREVLRGVPELPALVQVSRHRLERVVALAVEREPYDRLPG